MKRKPLFELRDDAPGDIRAMATAPCPRGVPHSSDGDIDTECLCHTCSVRRFATAMWAKDTKRLRRAEQRFREMIKRGQ